jgi:ubiquinone biosynthesis protein UbiJ
MLQEWTNLLAPAAQERLTLLLNHVLSRESVAGERLKPHRGAVVLIELKGWPAFMPSFVAPPPLCLQITPAGLLERLPEASAQPALRVQLDVSNPAALAMGVLAGERPKIEIQGDAALATDMSWLLDNLRWDIEDDLASWIGPAPAHELARIGKGIAAALASLAKSVTAMAGRGAA